MELHLDFLTRDQFAWLRSSGILGCGCDCHRALLRPTLADRLDFRAGIVRRNRGGRGVWSIYQLESGGAGRDLAIVTKTNVQARLATAESAGTVLLLPAGSEVKILSTRGDWGLRRPA